MRAGYHRLGTPYSLRLERPTPSARNINSLPRLLRLLENIFRHCRNRSNILLGIDGWVSPPQGLQLDEEIGGVPGIRAALYNCDVWVRREPNFFIFSSVKFDALVKTAAVVRVELPSICIGLGITSITPRDREGCDS